MRVGRGMLGHVQKVLGGEYDVPGLEGVERVVDLGANCGGFVLWARRRWPGCEVFGWEPWPESYGLLVENVGGEGMTCAAVVGSPVGSVRLFPGLSNDGEVSAFDTGGVVLDEALGVDVPAVDAADLPGCDFLKVDIEGGEFGVIPRYLGSHDLPAVVAYEWHGAAGARDLARVMGGFGYGVVEEDVWHPERGVVKWIRKDLV